MSPPRPRHTVMDLVPDSCTSQQQKCPASDMAGVPRFRSPGCMYIPPSSHPDDVTAPLPLPHLFLCMPTKHRGGMPCTGSQGANGNPGSLTT